MVCLLLEDGSGKGCVPGNPKHNPPKAVSWPRVLFHALGVSDLVVVCLLAARHLPGCVLTLRRLVSEPYVMIFERKK